MHKLNAGDSIEAEKLNENFTELGEKIEGSSNIAWCGTSQEDCDRNAYLVLPPSGWPHPFAYKNGMIIGFSAHADSSPSLNNFMVFSAQVHPIVVKTDDDTKSKGIIGSIIRKGVNFLIYYDEAFYPLNISIPQKKQTIVSSLDSGFTGTHIQRISHSVGVVPSRLKMTAVASENDYQTHKTSVGVYQTIPLTQKAVSFGTLGKKVEDKIAYVGDDSSTIITAEIWNLENNYIEIKWAKAKGTSDCTIDFLIELEA